MTLTREEALCEQLGVRPEELLALHDDELGPPRPRMVADQFGVRPEHLAMTFKHPPQPPRRNLQHGCEEEERPEAT